MTASEKHAPTTVNKPWGHELIWARTDRYFGKILHVHAGEALSLQYHRVKDETIMVLSGRLQFEFFAEGVPPSVRELVPREPFHIVPRFASPDDGARGHLRVGGVDTRAG